MNIYEISRVIELVGRFDAAFQNSFPDAPVRGHWRILAAVMRYEIHRRPLPLGALIAESGLPHATAIRHIRALIADGLIRSVPRSVLGKTRLYRPGPDLSARFEQYSIQVKGDLAGYFSDGTPWPEPEDYYLGGRHQQLAFSDDQLRAVTAIPGVSQMRFLARQDWYFMALRHAWSDLRRHIGPAQGFRLLDEAALDRAILRNADLAESEFDLVAVTPGTLRQMAQKGQLLPLPVKGAAHAPHYDRIHPTVWNLAAADGAHFGVPAFVMLDILAARRDWFEEEAVAFPGTLDDLVSAAERLHDPRRDRCGIVWPAASGLPLARSFLTFLRMQVAPPIRQEAAPENLEELLDPSEIGPASATWAAMRRLLALSPPDALSCDEDQAISRFSSGAAALCLVTSLHATRAEFDVTSTVRHRVSYLLPQVAGSAPRPLLDGFVLAVPANLAPARRERSFAVLRWMSGFDLSPREQDEGGKIPISPLFSLVRDPELARNSPIRNIIALLVKHKRIRLRPGVTDAAIPDTILLQALGQTLHEGLGHGLDWPRTCGNIRAALSAARRP